MVTGYSTLDESEHIGVNGNKFRRVSVLDSIGYVELQDVMGDDLAIVNAARVSYRGESKGEEKDAKLLFYLMEHKHLSPFEQVQFKFRIKMPILVARQLMRYRSAHFNEQSYRYTEVQEEEFYIPTEWRLQDSVNKQGSNGILDDFNSKYFTALLKLSIKSQYTDYKEAIDKGVAREEARLFLPAFALYTTVVMVIDCRNLMHMLQERMDSHAQWEIRQYANAIYDNFFKPILPVTAQAFERFVLNANN